MRMDQEGRHEKETEDDSATLVVATCARCGMEKDEWSVPDGVNKAGSVFCCQSCASGGECTCM